MYWQIIIDTEALSYIEVYPLETSQNINQKYCPISPKTRDEGFSIISQHRTRKSFTNQEGTTENYQQIHFGKHFNFISMGKIVLNQALRTVEPIKFVVKFGEGNTPQGCLLFSKKKHMPITNMMR